MLADGLTQGGSKRKESGAHSPLKPATALLFLSSLLRLMRDSWMGSCGQRALAVNLGPWESEGRSLALTPPDLAPYLAVLDQVGCSLLLGTSTCLCQPVEGRGKGSPACWPSRPCPRP